MLTVLEDGFNGSLIADCWVRADELFDLIVDAVAIAVEGEGVRAEFDEFTLIVDAVTIGV